MSGLDLNGTSHTNAGTYTDTWTFTDVTGNYYNASSTVIDVISKADASISVNPYSVTYDGAAHTASGTATGVGSIDLIAGLNLSGTTHTNAGDYPADAWTFAGGTNYNDASGTVHDAIAQASSTTTVTCPASVTYNGAAQTPCSALGDGSRRTERIDRCKLHQQHQRGYGHCQREFRR